MTISSIQMPAAGPEPTSSLLLAATGCSKECGQIDSERAPMTLEAEPQLTISTAGISRRIALRITVMPDQDDRPNIDLHQSTIELSLADARRLADSLANWAA